MSQPPKFGEFFRVIRESMSVVAAMGYKAAKDDELFVRDTHEIVSCR